MLSLVQGDDHHPLKRQTIGAALTKAVARTSDAVKFVDYLRMTVTGKVQKFNMREAMEEELGVKAAKTA